MEAETEKTPLELILELPDAPKREVVDSWKQRFGDIYGVIMPVSQKPFIFRTITRLEWQKVITSLQDAGASLDKESWVNERLVSTCVLWPSMTDPQTIRATAAGLVDSLASMIMQASDFVDPNMGMMMIRKL